MLKDRSRRVAKMGNVPEKWTKLGALEAGDFKGGTRHDYFVHAGREQASLKTKGAFIQLTPKGTRLSPGPQLQVDLPFGKVSFGEYSFNPLADQASSAVFPVATFVRTLPALDQDLAALIGIVAVLQAASQQVQDL